MYGRELNTPAPPPDHYYVIYFINFLFIYLLIIVELDDASLSLSLLLTSVRFIAMVQVLILCDVLM